MGATTAQWLARASGAPAPVAAARFIACVERAYPDAYQALSGVYGRRTETAGLLDELLDRALTTVLARPYDLQQRDAAREHEWACKALAGDRRYRPRRLPRRSFPGSFARGARFGYNPRTHDARISGTTASLAGIEGALAQDDDDLLSAAVSRLLLHAVLYGWGGIPLLYIGDEIGLRNDHRYLDDPAKAADKRWMHRPRMDWEAAARRHSAWTLEARLSRGLQRLAEARASTAHCTAPA